ncbi:MAG: HD domain-containing protein, partial [Silvanigrellaceae bacterium]|nr:HD domain-containing protein [Silvanigrellaceae bacterium]
FQRVIECLDILHFAELISMRNSHEKMMMIGKVRDPLHDIISITPQEKIIIASPEFQRLRRITQTSFIKYVFPGATHTRFEHSLGVMHVAGLMLGALTNNQIRLLAELSDAKEKSPQKAVLKLEEHEKIYGSLQETLPLLHELQENRYLFQCLRFAALLHDIGHGPFSHSGERFMVSWNTFKTELSELKIPQWLKEAFLKKIAKLSLSANPHLAQQPIRHEIYTLMCIAKLFQSKSDELLSENMGRDICAILDTNVVPAEGSVLDKLNLATLFHEIVSGEIDADRMDYLLRDSRQCGVVYGFFDLGRILDSIAFYKSPEDHSFHLAIRRSGVSAFEDFLKARWSMYQQVYFHKTATACEAMLEQAHKYFNNMRLPLNLQDYFEWDDHSFLSRICSTQQEVNEGYAKKILEDLILKRNLWKRVYEENIPITSLSGPSLCRAITGYLKSCDVPCELIESSTNLTRFLPKGRNTASHNKFKVIVKDVHFLKFLEPIENHSKLINRLDEETVIKRIFVSNYKTDGAVIDQKNIRQMIAEEIINPN